MFVCCSHRVVAVGPFAGFFFSLPEGRPVLEAMAMSLSVIVTNWFAAKFLLSTTRCSFIHTASFVQGRE